MGGERVRGRDSFKVEHDLFRPAYARRSIGPLDEDMPGLRAGGKPRHTFRDHARGEADMDASKGRVSPPRQRMQLSWTDPRFRGLVWQGVVVGVVAGIVVLVWRNTGPNLHTPPLSTRF